MLIILGVVARSGYGSGRFGSCHANVERVTTMTVFATTLDSTGEPAGQLARLMPYVCSDRYD